MKNKIINLVLGADVARGLEELRERVVFIGGAVISLYTDDPAAEEIRPTGDIDMTVDLASYTEMVAFQERLIDLGFNPDPQGHSIVSYVYNNIAIDIMPSQDSGMGISNKWYRPGFEFLQVITLENNLDIRILPAPYFLATKFEAFKDRGNNDFLFSHDYEDIIYVMDNRTSIVEEILNSDDAVKNYLKEELQKLIDHRQSSEILSMHIHPLVVKDRYPMLLEKILKILE
jgi:hypothetical protein